MLIAGAPLSLKAFDKHVSELGLVYKSVGYLACLSS